MKINCVQKNKKNKKQTKKTDNNQNKIVVGLLLDKCKIKNNIVAFKYR